MKWVSWTNFGLGIWLIAAPFVLAYGNVSSALYDDVLLGVLIASFALSRVLGERLGSGAAVGWSMVAGGLWVLMAPFALGYSATTAAAYNDVSVGVLVLILTSWQAASRPRGRMPHLVTRPQGVAVRSDERGRTASALSVSGLDGVEGMDEFSPRRTAGGAAHD